MRLKPPDGIARKQWESAHTCPRCGNVINLEEINLRTIATGIIACPKCEWSRPRVDYSVNLVPWGNPDSYFVSLDLPTARHPQTLPATHINRQPLTMDHGAPLRLRLSVELGLKDVKAITKIWFVAEEPKDYRADRRYSRFGGI